MEKDKLIGKRFGKLVVIKRVPNLNSKQKYHPHKYECICDCVNKKEILGKDLLKKTKSCGCIKGYASRLSLEKVNDILSKRNLYMCQNTIYRNTKTKMNLIDSNGYKYFISLNSVRDSRTAKLEIIGKSNPYSIENIQRWLTIQGTKTQVIDDKYVKDNIKMTFKCECGSIFKTNWNTMRFYKTFRCQKCTHKQSKNEKLTEEYLIFLNIEYETEKYFIDCRNKLPYKFDFYLPKYNAVIEVHGEQHYVQNKFFSLSLEEQQRRDKEKKLYCLRNNIGYHVIPYWHFDIKKYKETINKIIG